MITAKEADRQHKEIANIFRKVAADINREVWPDVKEEDDNVYDYSETAREHSTYWGKP